MEIFAYFGKKNLNRLFTIAKKYMTERLYLHNKQLKGDKLVQNQIKLLNFKTNEAINEINLQIENRNKFKNLIKSKKQKDDLCM